MAFPAITDSLKRFQFQPSGQKSYTAIKIELAKAHGLNIPDYEIALKAEQFAISSGNGRSPRTARQFITQLGVTGDN